MAENPSAFPLAVPGDCVMQPEFGMSLRDWFATFAPAPNDNTMNSQRAFDRNRNPHNDAHKPRARTDHEIRAELAYAFADAMLTARETNLTTRSTNNG